MCAEEYTQFISGQTTRKLFRRCIPVVYLEALFAKNLLLSYYYHYANYGMKLTFGHGA